MLLWKIAWRNIWRHKGKSLAIGCILFLGALLMTVGNAVIDGSRQGLQRNAVETFTGHLTLVAGAEDTTSIFFSENVVPLKLLPNYDELKQLLSEQDTVEGFLPMNRGYALILNDDGVSELGAEAGENAAFVFGVDFDDYQQMYRHNVIAVEGRLLKDGERGVLITETERERIYQQHGFWVIPQGASLNEDVLPPEALAAKDRLPLKEELVFVGLSGESLEADIRLPVRGIVRFKSFNAVWKGSFMDIESFRHCFGFLTAAAGTVELSEDQNALLALEGEDDLFAGDDVVDEIGTGVVDYDVEAMQQQTRRAKADVDTEKGAYQFVTVRLKPEVSLKEGAKHLERLFADAGISVKALTWKEATGAVGQFAGLTQGILLVFVLFVFFVSAIVIANTLSMSAIERVSEIGMMRAIGAARGLIGRMFFAEIAVLSAIFGGLGILVGLVVVWGITSLHIPATGNQFLTMLAGDDVLRPLITLAGIFFGIAQVAVVTALSALYPVKVARTITALEAISRD
jgi:ABC-type lipoprotein release transport system permease subunit